MSFERATGIVSADEVQYIDHLATLGALLDFPLICLGENEAKLAREFYPKTQVIEEIDQAITPSDLLERHDVLFLSDLWSRSAFAKVFASLEQAAKRELRRVFCPHGFSDKAFYFRQIKEEDLCLVYGQHMLDFLKKEGLLETLSGTIHSGNYRYTYYKENRKFYDDLVMKVIRTKFSDDKPLILYAPTWHDHDESSSFFNAVEYVMGTLPQEFNLLVKLHPMLEKMTPENYYQILGKYENRPNILFLADFPPVYPLLNKASAYIGDMSAIGYDYLTFNRPLFFLSKSDQKEAPYLYRCGKVIPPEKLSTLYSEVAQSLEKPDQDLSKKRQEVYQYTFGEERRPSDIAKDIKEAFKTPRLSTG